MRQRLSLIEVRNDLPTEGTWRSETRDTDDAMELLIYDAIGEGNVSTQQLVETIRNSQGRKLSVRINSAGGYVFDGIAIYNALAMHSGEVAVTIDGLAASAASIIAMGGDRVAMYENAMMLIHNSWGVAMGDKHTARDLADTLAMIDEQLARIYAARARRKPETFARMMDARPDGTKLSAQDALEARLIDEIIPVRNEPAARNEERKRLMALARERWLSLAGHSV